MDSTAPASLSYINHPKVETEEEKVDVVPKELAVKANVEDASQLRLDSISEATSSYSLGFEGEQRINRRICHLRRSRAGWRCPLSFLSFFLEGFIEPTNVGLGCFSLSALRHVLSPLLSCRIEYIFFAASGRRR
jgi:hypothetical protein